MNDFKVGDIIKHRQTKHRTWEVASYNRRTGRLVLQRVTTGGRIVTQTATRPEEYRVVERDNDGKSLVD